MKESAIQRQILDWLERSHIFCWRHNVGGMAGSHKGKRWFVRFGKPGMPDIFAVWRGLITAIEVKGPKGRLSPEQEAWRDEFRRAGGFYVVARRLEDVTELWEASQRPLE